MKSFVLILLITSFALTDELFAQARITGRVTNAETGDALSGVTVSVENEWGENLTPPVQALTNEQGDYVLEVDSAATYRLVAEFQQEVAGRTLVFGLPTRLLDMDNGVLQFNFLYQPLPENSPAFQFIAENSDGLVHPSEAWELGAKEVARSIATDAHGTVVSIGGGYFEIE